jgi:hypothetical protein
MSEVLTSQKETSSWVLSRAALVGMLVQPETVPTAHQLTVPTEGSNASRLHPGQPRIGQTGGSVRQHRRVSSHRATRARTSRTGSSALPSRKSTERSS